MWDNHVHIENGPYTIEWLNEFIEVAKNRRLDGIGITEHAYRFKQTRDLIFTDGFRGEWIVQRQIEDIDEYIDLIEEAKRLGLPVKLGTEMDYIPEREKEIKDFLTDYHFDYVIGSIHWLGDFGIDLDAKYWDKKNIDDVYDEYYSTMFKLIKSGIADVIGHIDLVKIFGFRPKTDLADIYTSLAKEIKRAGISVEVSTAGLRKPVKEIYPSPEILKILKGEGVNLVLSSDAHDPQFVGYMFDEAESCIKEC
ncbi:MAG: histidinol-phosphatase [Thermoanaerobacteraceae bacterium]|nr:histidinol-phosphatase [Thermoanaerobacteraceae bacterium]